jgi:hypothetical protein
MQRHSHRKLISFLGLALPGAVILVLGALAGEPLPDRPGFGYTIQFSSGTTAEATLPTQRQPLPDRPGFDYTISFVPSDPAESLYPPGWVKQRHMKVVSQH